MRVIFYEAVKIKYFILCCMCQAAFFKRCIEAGFGVRRFNVSLLVFVFFCFWF